MSPCKTTYYILGYIQEESLFHWQLGVHMMAILHKKVDKQKRNDMACNNTGTWNVQITVVSVFTIRLASYKTDNLLNSALP